jgi:YVTN family beta-propeller protein
MPNRHAPRPVLATVTAAVLLLPSAGAQDATSDYEVWALDQGTNTIYILTPELEVAETIVLPDTIDMPHMIDFTSDGAYAFIANVASGNVAVVRAADREVVSVIPTGTGTHYAGVVPGDETVVVAVIGDRHLVEIAIDPANESFLLGRHLVVADDPAFAARADEFPGSSPVCHAYTHDGRYAYVTLGPALADAGLLVLDVEAFELARVFPPSEVRSNCGTGASPNGERMFLTGGSLEESLWYAFDTSTHELVTSAATGGTDAHGIAFTPDGGELWLVNRHSSDGVVIDPHTLETIDEIPFTGRSPDILVVSPDGRYVFVTLRGPEPRSGPHAIMGDTPGVAVLDVATRELVTVIEPDRGNGASDFHGIGLRSIGN